MYSVENITDAFLDIDRAGSVFELFFVFVRDDGSAVQDEQTFEAAMREIVGGAYIPEEALERVREIYQRTAESRPVLYDSAVRLKGQLSHERLLLVMVFSVLLRLAMDEGMMCRSDRERLTEVFQVFRLTPEEIQLVPDELQLHLESFFYVHRSNTNSFSKRKLTQHFETLECTPESSSEEVRSSYRRLVKKYHPDRASRSNSDTTAHRQQFEKVQAAYETITRVKKIQ